MTRIVHEEKYYTSLVEDEGREAETEDQDTLTQRITATGFKGMEMIR